MIFDASALLALLRGEAGRDLADRYLSGASISTVNLSEAIAVLIRKGIAPEAAQEAIEELELEVVPFDRDHAYRAAALLPVTAPYGLSLGDRACLALALARKAPAVTTEKQWDHVAVGVKIIRIR
jgi:PIN domain nuclease of toxin-antitoxin system